MRYSALAGRAATRAVLEAHGHAANYRLGQNFLIDDAVVGKILALAGVGSGSVDGAERAAQRPAFLEVGPGIGTLSVALLPFGDVVAIERDESLADVLADTTAGYAGRFLLIRADALKVDAAVIERACADAGMGVPRLLVANLPYNVAATLVLDYFERMGFLDAMVVMVQSEVADRMCATPGTKTYGAYTVKLRLHARVVERFSVAPGSFLPAPHVESAVVRLERNASGIDAPTRGHACELAEAAFAQRRKNIRNSMRSRYDVELVDELLRACGISPNVRGETLQPDDFVRMARAYEELLAR